MQWQTIHSYKRMLWAYLPFLALSFSISAAAATTTAPESGSYCPGPDVLLVVAEELSASLDMAMRSQAALINSEQGTALSTLTSAGTELHLAASRGAAARTNLLIDAILQAKSGEDYARMLAWFPLLHTSLLTLPDDATVSAADELISRAEEIMQNNKDGDPIKSLRQARHLLACDSLDIPLQEAMQAQGNLIKQIGQNTKNSAYDTLIDSLRSALLYTLQNRP